MSAAKEAFRPQTSASQDGDRSGIITPARHAPKAPAGVRRLPAITETNEPDAIWCRPIRHCCRDPRHLVGAGSSLLRLDEAAVHGPSFCFRMRGATCRATLQIDVAHTEIRYSASRPCVSTKSNSFVACMRKKPCASCRAMQRRHTSQADHAHRGGDSDRVESGCAADAACGAANADPPGHPAGTVQTRCRQLCCERLWNSSTPDVGAYCLAGT